MLSIYHALRILWLIIFVCVLFVNGKSQPQVNIVVRNASDSVAISDATVTIYHADVIQINTNVDGIVSLSVEIPTSVKIFKGGYRSQTVKLISKHTVVYLQPLIVDLTAIEIKSTGLYYQTVSESAYQIKLIDKKQIEQKAGATLNDVLLTQPGIRISQDPILGGNLQLNGLGGQNVKLMVDGIPINGRENGNIDLNQIALQQVASVEIIEGPLSSIYGSDALGGVINIISSSQVDAPFIVNASGKYESVGNYNANLGIAGGNKKAWYHVSGARNFFDGYPEAGSERAQLWNPRVQYAASAMAGYRYNKNELRIKSSYLDETLIDKNPPTITPYEAYAFDDQFLTRRASADITYTHNWNNKKSIKITGAYNSYLRQKTSYRKDLVTLENKELSSDPNINTSLYDMHMLRILMTDYTTDRKLKYNAGSELQMDAARGARLRNNFQEFNSISAFGNVEFTVINKILVRPSLRISHNSRFGNPVTPSLHLRINPAKNYVVRISAAKGFRAPSLKELDINFIDANHNITGNNNLKPEEALNFQANLSKVWYAQSIMIEAGFNSFYNKIENLITLGLTDAVLLKYTYINSGSFRNYGLGAMLNARSNSWQSSIAFNLVGNSGLMKQAKYYTPELNVTSGYINQKKGFEINGFFKANGVSRVIALSSLGESALMQSGAFSMFDLIASKTVLGNRVKFVFGVKNILNVTNVVNSTSAVVPHATGPATPVAMGRNYIVELRFEFRKKVQ